MNIYKSILATILILSVNMSSFGQVDSVDQDIKIGLALSGGAAHGFAHLGVIKYLEEMEIPVDYITGTSMGAVVGGLYAMGYRYDDIYKMAKSQDWSHIITNTVPMSDVSAIEKHNHNKYPLYLIFNGRKVHLPSGVLGGQKMDLIISNMYCAAHFIDDYDELPIPFRCVAVNLVDGEIHQFDSGYLGRSIRASMAIPTVFPPVDLDDKLFVDGGMIRNFPVEENIELGADIVIGSYVGTRQKRKDELVSLIDILKQSAGMANILDSKEQASKADVVVYPDTEDLSLFAFEDYDNFIKLGYKAARKDSLFFKDLKQKIKSRDYKPVEKLDLPDRIQVNKIVLHTNNPITQKLISGKLGFKEGDYVSLKQIEQGISDVFGTNYFSKVNYDFFKYREGVGMEIISEDAHPLKLGLNFNRFEYFGPSTILSAEFRNVFGRPSSLNVIGRVSSRPGLDATYRYRFSDNPSWLVQARSGIESVELPFFINRLLERSYRHQLIKHRISIIKELSKESYLSLTAMYMIDRIKPKFLKANDIDKIKRKQAGIGLNFYVNTESSKVFAHSGINFSATANYYFEVKQTREFKAEQDFLSEINSGNYGSINAIFKYNVPIAKNFTLVTRIQGAYFTKDMLLDHFRFGGPFQEHTRFTGFLGLNDSEWIISNHISSSIMLQIKVLDFLYLNPAVSYLYGENMLSLAFDDVENADFYGYGIGLAVKTPLGPVSFDVGNLSKDSKLKTNFRFGFKHILY
jgi:NTE family protein